MLAIVVVLVVARSRRRPRPDVDAPGRLVANAARRLPADRQEWARAMVAELAYIEAPARRWRYAISAVRVVALPPTRHPRRTAVVAGAGLLIAATVATAAHRGVPTLTLFAGVLGVALALYATARAARTHQRVELSVPYLLVAATAVVVIAATIVSIVRVAATHPAATTDPTHVFSIALALILTGYVAIALRPHTRARTLWWALGSGLGAYAVWATAALVVPAKLDGTLGYLWIVGAVAAATAAIGAGARAGVLTVILTAPAHVAIDLTTLLSQRQYTLSSPYDITAYPRSGYPDIASYLLGDAIGGETIAGLMLYPVLLSALAFACASIGRRPQRLA